MEADAGLFGVQLFDHAAVEIEIMVSSIAGFVLDRFAVIEQHCFVWLLKFQYSLGKA